MKKSLVLIMAATILAGCSSTKYTAPAEPEQPKFDTVVNQGYDQTWEAIIDHVSSTFFAIDNFEKESGLITVTFGSDSPDDFINCGNHDVQVTRNYRTFKFNGPYENFVIRTNGSFAGRMNISARNLTKNETEVRVNAKYVLQNSVGNTWNFNSGSSADVYMENTNADSKVRTCYPTYKAEKSILNAVKKIAE